MSEWWTYRPADLLMFAPSTYWRLFEFHNRATWPAPLLLPACGLTWLAWFAWRPSAPAWRAAALAAAASCAFVGASFLWLRYAPINWAAAGFAVGFGVLVLLWLCLAALRLPDLEPRSWRHRAGLLMLLWALAVYPLIGVAFGRPLVQAEVIGLAPDPTIVGGLGLLLLGGRAGRAPWLLRPLWGLALLWCGISAATLWTMGSAQAAMPVAAALVALAATRWGPPAAHVGRR